MIGVPVRGRILLGAVLALSGCSGTDVSAPTATGGVREITVAPALARAQAIARIADDVILPGYRDLDATTAALRTALASNCAAGTDVSRTAAQEGYRAARRAWSRTSAFRFGAVMDLEAEPAIAFAIDGDKVDKLVDRTGSADPITAASLTKLGADVRGLGGIEHVLFAEPSRFDRARACAYLGAAAELVATKSAAVLRAWTDGLDAKPSFRDQMNAPGADRMWATEQEVVADLVNGTIHALNVAADQQLGKASGEISGSPEPTDVDAGPARSALDDIAATVRSAQQLVDVGLGALVNDQSPATTSKLNRQLADSLTAIDAIPPPLHDVAGPTLEPVRLAYQQVRAARITMRTEVASQLGVALSFSADGDG